MAVMGYELHAAGILGLMIGLVALYIPLKMIYNVWFHPLRRFPGPFLHRSSIAGYCYRLSLGSLSQDLIWMHAKYGPVVRIGPDNLSFIDPEAWRDIYGHRAGAQAGKDEFKKDQIFYYSKLEEPSLINETRENHSIIRRHLSNGFSDRSMRQQEPIIGSYVDLLISRLRENCVKPPQTITTKDGEAVPVVSESGPEPQPLDIKTWYNWTTFDIIGDLALGEPFHCLENTESHPWVQAITDMIKFLGVLLSIKTLGLGWLLDILIVNFKAHKPRHTHLRNLTEKLDRRVSLTKERPDLIEGLVSLKGLSKGKLRSNASTLVIAGSETTATLLTGATYLLLSNPDKLERLKREVRSSFDDDSQITLMSVSKLSYMLACLDESLRRYPPVAFGMPRNIPKGGAEIAGHWVPEGSVVGVWQLAAYLSERNFEDPMAFKPERWLNREDPNRTSRDKLDVVQPFSIGPRNCIGRNLAYSEMRLILARLLFNFDIELVDKEEDWINQRCYILWEKPTLNVYLTPVR